MPTNNFLPFAPTDTGTNLLSQSDYAAAADRTIGNQPGVASSKLVNKAIRQSAYVVSQVAQWLANQTGADIVDDATPAKLLAQINAAMKPIAPTITKYTSGSGNHNLTYWFFIATGSATSGATYTNNGITYTVVSTVASGVQIKMTGNGAPTVSGTLTKASGTGDTTLTFYAMRVPLYLIAQATGGGGAGGTTGSVAGATGGDGVASSFGTMTAPGGVGGTSGTVGGAGAAGGVAGVNGDVNLPGGYGGSGAVGGAVGQNAIGGLGGTTIFGGAGVNGSAGTAWTAGGAAATNSGAGGGGGSATNTSFGGGGGGSGAYSKKNFNSPSGTYAYVVGAGGTPAAGTGSTGLGGTGGDGMVLVEEYYQ